MGASLLSPVFVIGSIRIGTVEGASCVNLGNNYPTGFESHKKHNQGFGSIGGNNNTIRDGRTLLNDSDFLDMFAGNAGDMPKWLEQAVLETEKPEKT